jgi:DnaJ-class molecular chaperone
MSQDIPQAFPDFEIACQSCGGRGGFDGRRPSDFLECRNCNGSGYVPTEFGRKALALVAHNFRSPGRDATELGLRVY